MKTPVSRQCADNHGMFVRPTQLTLLDDGGNPVSAETASPEEKQPRSRLSRYFIDNRLVYLYVGPTIWFAIASLFYNNN